MRAAIDELLACPLTALTDDEVLEVARSVEVGRRRLETFDQPLVAELDARALVDRNLAPSTGAFLAGLWNLSPGVAARRVRQVRALGPRVTLTGDRLEPLRPCLAAARAEGAITGEHVEVILQTLDKLPTALPVEQVDSMEQTLLGHARTFHPGDVRGIGKHLLSVLNPDGVLTEEKDQQRRRNLGLVPSGDGMHRLSGELDDECAAVAMAVLHALAAPMPTDAGGRDGRADQHDETAVRDRHRPRDHVIRAETHRPHRPTDRRPGLDRVDRARLQTQTPDARPHPAAGE